MTVVAARDLLRKPKKGIPGPRKDPQTTQKHSIKNTRLGPHYMSLLKNPFKLPPPGYLKFWYIETSSFNIPAQLAAQPFNRTSTYGPR